MFLRLAGCNLQCPKCDTDYTSKRTNFLCQELLNELLETCVCESLYATPLLIITGGEPYRQKAIFNFLNIAQKHFRSIQIETNGTYSVGEDPAANIHIVCSPKTPKVHDSVIVYCYNWKYVLGADHVAEDGLPTNVLGYDVRPARPPWHVDKTCVYLQPEHTSDEDQNKRNLDACVASCMKHGYRLCLQVQKICNLP